MNNIQLSTDYKKMIANAVKGGVEYIKENPNIKTLVVGISGGIDSAVTAYLARLTADLLGDIKVLGQCMPIDGNKSDEIERAIKVGRICHSFVIKDLNDAFLSNVRYVDGDLFHKYSNPKDKLTHDEKVAAGNIKARTRMINLYNLAGFTKGMVLSTDNLTELELGFWTLHGDVGDFGFIQKLWKTEVYGIGDIIGGVVKECVEANPTDGLGVTNSDVDQLVPGFDGNHREAYKLVDDILIDYLSGTKIYASDHPVVKRHVATKFKRLNPVSIERDMLLWNH